MNELAVVFEETIMPSLLAGKKTQARQIISPTNADFGSAPPYFWSHADFDDAFVDGTLSQYLHVAAHRNPSCWECDRHGWTGTRHRLWPRMAPASEWQQQPDAATGYVPPASRLWVAEGWRRWDNGGRQIAYRADLQCLEATEEDGQWLVFDAGNRLGSDPGGWSPANIMPRWTSRMVLEVKRVRAQRLQDILEEDALAEGVAEEQGRYSFAGGMRYDTAVGAYRAYWEQVHGAESWTENPRVWEISFAPVKPATGESGEATTALS